MAENQYLELEWPSRRIPAGGVFHNTKVNYSPDVQNIMKVLIEESKLTLAQRRHVDWCLRTGSSLNESKYSIPKTRKTSAPIAPKNRPIISRRRSLTAIQKSGDFERERYNPITRTEDREIIKKHLQDVMEFGKIQSKMSKLHIDKIKPKQLQRSLPTREEMFNDLLTQIKERVEWLKDMETLGEGFKHRDVIHHEIAERMTEIEKFKIYSDTDLQNCKSNSENETLLKHTGIDKTSKIEKNLKNQNFFNIKKSTLNY